MVTVTKNTMDRVEVTSVKLNEGLFEGCNTDVSLYENNYYLEILSEVEDIYKTYDDYLKEVDEDETNIIEFYENNIYTLNDILERTNEEYEYMKNNVEKNLKESYWEVPIDSYWEGIYDFLEELVDKKDVRPVFDELYEFDSVYSKLTIDDLTSLTKIMRKELDIENDVRWNREYKEFLEMVLEDPLWELEEIHKKVCNELKKKIDDYTNIKNPIIEMFIF